MLDETDWAVRPTFSSNARKDQPPADRARGAEHHQKSEARPIALGHFTATCCHRDGLPRLTVLGAVGWGKDVLALHLHPLNFSLMMLIEEAFDRSDLSMQLVRLLTGCGRFGLRLRVRGRIIDPGTIRCFFAATTTVRWFGRKHSHNLLSLNEPEEG